MTYPVLIVGAGPVGLTTANLLMARDVPVVLVERNPTTSDEAKAISLDDESLRTLQSADLADTVLGVVVPGTGTRYYGRNGRPLFHARGPEPYRLGYPFKNQFAQPELEQILLQGLKARDGADLRFETELVALGVETAEGVGVRLRSSDGRTHDLTVSWVLGCDGGRSTIRELRGIGMTGTSHRDVWLVTDTTGDPHDERYAMHLGRPARPTVIVPGRGGRCRYEFRLYDGEGTGGTRPDFATISRLVSPYRKISPDQVERATNYTFNAVVADRWRDGRCLLLGDAAHMMPPFAGQGLNSGIRDAANLAWKIAEVWHGRATDALLDTYESERRPHATETVAFSERLGRIVMGTSKTRALLRDLAIHALLVTGPGRRYLTEMRFRPTARHQAGLVLGDHDLTGTALPQPRVLLAPCLRPRPLDDVLGDGFALLGVDVNADDWAAAQTTLTTRLPIQPIDVALGDRLPTTLADRPAIADTDGRLESALGTASGRFVLLKPDRYIAAVFPASQAERIAQFLRHWSNRVSTVRR